MIHISLLPLSLPTYFWLPNRYNNLANIYETHTLVCKLRKYVARYLSFGGRDRIVVSTLRCGRNNPGSNPGHGRKVGNAYTINLFFYLRETIGKVTEKIMFPLTHDYKAIDIYHKFI